MSLEHFIEKFGKKNNQEYIDVITLMGNQIGNMHYKLSDLGVHLCLECISIIERNDPEKEEIKSIIDTLEKYICELHHVDFVYRHFLAWCITQGHLDFEEISHVFVVDNEVSRNKEKFSIPTSIYFLLSIFLFYIAKLILQYS